MDLIYMFIFISHVSCDLIHLAHALIRHATIRVASLESTLEKRSCLIVSDVFILISARVAYSFFKEQYA